MKELEQYRGENKKLVFTNGCFDVLHVGHTRYLREAKALGDVLIVGLNSDSSVAKLKGSERPIVPEEERREMLLALESVDEVFIFEEETPLSLIENISPDVLVKGGDWPLEEIVGYEHVSSNGGEVRSLSFFDGHSTTNIIEKIKSLSD